LPMRLAPSGMRERQQAACSCACTCTTQAVARCQQGRHQLQRQYRFSLLQRAMLLPGRSSLAWHPASEAAPVMAGPACSRRRRHPCVLGCRARVQPRHTRQ
jgi:hypothetical protein